MPTLRVNGLRPEVWRTLTPDERVEALQEMEDRLASQEDRTPATVRLFKPGEVEPGLRGGYDPSTNTIGVNPAFVDPEASASASYADDGSPVDANEPYMAAHTLFHEDEHAHQRYVADKRPDLADSPEQLKDFQTNRPPGGYISNADDVLYSVQPVEIDARDVAQERMDQCYAGDQGYATHRAHRSAEELQTRGIAEEQLGEGYLQAAREEVYYRAEEYEALRQSDAEAMEEQGLSGDSGPAPEPQSQMTAGAGLEELPQARAQADGPGAADDAVEAGSPNPHQGTDQAAGEQAPGTQRPDSLENESSQGDGPDVESNQGDGPEVESNQGDAGEGIPLEGPAGAEDAYDQSYDYGMGY